MLFRQKKYGQNSLSQFGMRIYADLCWVMGPLAIHIKLVLVLPFWKIDNGYEGVLTLANDTKEDFDRHKG